MLNRHTTSCQRRLRLRERYRSCIPDGLRYAPGRDRSVSCAVSKHYSLLCCCRATRNGCNSPKSGGRRAHERHLIQHSGLIADWRARMNVLSHESNRHSYMLGTASKPGARQQINLHRFSSIPRFDFGINPNAKIASELSLRPTTIPFDPKQHRPSVRGRR
jgi:hypothetical protein